MPIRSFLFWMIQGFYLLLMGMALYFFEERLSSDTSYYFFKSLNAGFFHVEHQRWVLALAELPVVLLSRLGAPLSVVAQAYSLGHVLFFWTIGLIIYLRYRNLYAWLLLIMLQAVGIREGFIGPVFEQFYGTALSVLFYLHLQHDAGRHRAQLVLSLLLYLFILSSHPFNGILVWFILMLHTTETRTWKRLMPYVLVLILFVLFKKSMASEYESGKMNWIFDLEHNKTYRLLFDPEHLLRRCKFLLHYYPDWLLACSASIIYFVQKKQGVRLFWCISFLGASLLLINFSYSIEEYSRYHEQVYYLIVPLVLFPLLFNAFPEWGKGRMYPLLLVCTSSVLMFRFSVQWSTARQFHTKVAIARQLVDAAQTQEGCLFFVPAQYFQYQSKFVDWDMSFFTLLYSAMHHYPKQVSVLPIEDSADKVMDIKKGMYWFRGGEAEPIQKLNASYFQLCATGYAPLKLP